MVNLTVLFGAGIQAGFFFPLPCLGVLLHAEERNVGRSSLTLGERLAPGPHAGVAQGALDETSSLEEESSFDVDDERSPYSIMAEADIRHVVESVSSGGRIFPPSRHSAAFADAYMKYQKTGICTAWTNKNSNLVVTGIHEEDMLEEMEHLPWTGGLQWQDLLDLIKNFDTGVRRVVKIVFLDPLSLTCVIMGGALFIIWLFGLSWQACVAGCRAACFCMPAKKRDLSRTTLFLIVICSGLLAFSSSALLLIGQAGIIRGISSIGSAACVAMQTLPVVELGTNTGKDLSQDLLTPNGEIPEFIGLHPLLRQLGNLETLCSATSDENVVKLISERVQDYKDIDQHVHDIEIKAEALKFNVSAATAVLGKYKMTNLFAEAVNAKPGVIDTVASECRRAAKEYKKQLSDRLDDATLPDIDLAGLVEVGSLRSTVDNIMALSEGITRKATPMARWLPISLTLESLAVVIGLVLGIVSLLIFYISEGRYSTGLTATSWNWLFAGVAFSLVITGTLFYSTVVGKPICQALADQLRPKNPGRTDTKLLGFDTENLGKCIQKPNANLLEVTGNDHLLENAETRLYEFRNAIAEGLSGISEFVDESGPMRSWADTLAQLAVFDSTALLNDESTKPLLATYPEMLTSGLQEQAVEVEHLDGVVTIIHGMEKVRQLIKPASTPGHRTPETTFVVTANNPDPDNPVFERWLDEQMERIRGELALENVGADSMEDEANMRRTHLKNAIILTRMKLRALEEVTECHGLSHGLEGFECSGKQLFGGSSGKNYLQKTAADLSTAVSDYHRAVVSHAHNAAEYADTAVSMVETLVVNIVKSLSCGFARKNIIQAGYLICPEGVRGIWKSALLRFIGLLLAILLAVCLMIIWRILKDNDTIRKQSERTEEDPTQTSESLKETLLGEDENDAGGVQNFEETPPATADDAEERENATDVRGDMWA